jgi:hypothetical protein
MPIGAESHPSSKSWGKRAFVLPGRHGPIRGMTNLDAAAHRALLRRGFALEYATLGWNLAGIVVLAIAAWSARSVALAGFGLDSLIEIGASVVVVWELSGVGQARQRRALRLLGGAFAALAALGQCLAETELVTDQDVARGDGRAEIVDEAAQKLGELVLVDGAHGILLVVR